MKQAKNAILKAISSTTSAAVLDNVPIEVSRKIEEANNLYAEALEIINAKKG